MITSLVAWNIYEAQRWLAAIKEHRLMLGNISWDERRFVVALLRLEEEMQTVTIKERVPSYYD